MPRHSTADVHRYYDANTAAFVHHGQGAALGAIHRAVWGPGVRTRAQAFQYVESRILSDLETRALDRPCRVLDLGCGVGGSLIYLATHRPLDGIGVTISPVQAHLGHQRILAHGLADRLRIIEADFGHLPEDVRGIDLAYAIESFVHAPSPERFLTEAARAVRPGGLLILCDDVRASEAGSAAEATIAQFTRGWHVNALLTAAQLHDLAARAGFGHVSTTDLTPYLELRRPRDYAIGALVRAVGWMPGLSIRLAPLVGGHALQRALSRGWIAYHYVVFRRERA